MVFQTITSFITYITGNFDVEGIRSKNSTWSLSTWSPTKQVDSYFLGASIEVLADFKNFFTEFFNTSFERSDFIFWQISIWIRNPDSNTIFNDVIGVENGIQKHQNSQFLYRQDIRVLLMDHLVRTLRFQNYDNFCSVFFEIRANV